MVNVFGESGQRGEDWKPGKDALPITTWFPKEVVQWWWNQSVFIYKDGKITGLKNHARKYDAISEGEIGELEKIDKGYSLHFKNSLYSIPQISLADAEISTTCVTLSF